MYLCYIIFYMEFNSMEVLNENENSIEKVKDDEKLAKISYFLGYNIGCEKDINNFSFSISKEDVPEFILRDIVEIIISEYIGSKKYNHNEGRVIMSIVGYDVAYNNISDSYNFKISNSEDSFELSSRLNSSIAWFKAGFYDGILNKDRKFDY